MSEDLYPIVARAPKQPRPLRLNLPKIKASMAALVVGGAFTIPADELRDRAGLYRTRNVGWRLHRTAGTLGIRVSVKKLKDGLRVRREK
jgi:hypothetical protein